MLALEGKQLGNYDVIRRIRVGGMGAVYEGRQRTAFGRRVAIKVILGSYADDPDMRRRFAREARTVARLHHPHILPLIEFGEEQGLLYLVMPFIEGGTLTSFLQRSLPSLGEVSDIYLQLLEAVEYAHDEGLIHRDIKSSNVLLEQRRSGPPHVYLADFGLVRISQHGQTEQEGRPIPLDQVPGTPYYMAPEQTRGIVTASSDIYALGVLLYQMLVGELPYDDPDEIEVIQMHLHAPIPSPCEQDASIPGELGEVVRIAMAKHPEDRFGSVAELREAFLTAVAGPPVVRQSVPAYEGVLPLDEPGSFSDRPVSRPLLAQDAPLPLPVKGRVPPRRIAPVVPRLVRRRITVGSKQAGHRHFTAPVLATMAVPIVLLILLLMPRVFDVSFFPSGFPVFGTAPVATVTITPAGKLLQNIYLLTASPQVSSPDPATRVIPLRNLNSVATAGRLTETTGTKLLAGARAKGLVLFQNSRESFVFVPAGIVFKTGVGIQIQLTESVHVPPRHGGQNGTASGHAVAVSAGVDGNIPAGTLDTTCCEGLSVSNPRSFAGGVDAHSVHVLAQADLDKIGDVLGPGLQQQALQQLRRQLETNEVLAGAPAYTVTVSSNYPVGAQVDRVMVRVNVSAASSAYNHYTASHMAAQLLGEEATQSLGSNYQLQGKPSVATLRVVQRGQNGLIYLSVTVHGRWVYAFSTQQLGQWRQSIKGASSALALAYLNAQAGVAAVRIQLPFGSDHIPSSVDQIRIVLAD
jgi:hypothetical protein